MKPEPQIRTTYADILNPADAANLRIIGDLDLLYTSTPIPTAPAFNTLVASHARTASRPAPDDAPETPISAIAGGGVPPRARHGWLRQGFAFAGAAIAFALVASVLIVLFRGSDNESKRGALPTTTAVSVYEIAYVSAREDGSVALIATRSDGSGQRTIMTGTLLGQPAWSPDGRWIAIAAGGDRPPGLYLVDASTGTATQLTSTDEETFDQLPVFSDDGSMIAFIRSSTTNGSDIWLVKTAGGEPRQLTEIDGYQVLGSWSPDGTQIAFTSIPPDSTTSDVYVIRTDDGTPRKLSNNAGWDGLPDWSPDGSQILFHSDADGENDLMLVNEDGSDLRNLTASTPGSSFAASWSPDGEWITFLHDRDGSSVVSVMQADGSQIVSLAEARSYSPGAVWSPNSRQLAFTTLVPTGSNSTTPSASSTAPGELHVINRDGSGKMLLAESVDTSVRPVWSPVPANATIVTPEPSPTNPSPTPTTTVSGTLDALGPLQVGQERRYVFDVQTDYRTDESNFRAWTVEGHERMLAENVLEQHLIARDPDGNVIAEYVIDDERWWWNQRGWIESGTAAAGVAPMPDELKIAMMEPHSAHRALTGDTLQVIDEHTEGNTRITRYQIDSMAWIGQHLGTTVESAYYEVYTTSDPVRVTRTRMVLVTPDDDERPEYALSDIIFNDVVLFAATDDPGMYNVPEAPAEETLQYTPPITLPDGLTLDNHWREFPGGSERLTISGNELRIAVIVYPSRGAFDPRPMQNRSDSNGSMNVATGFLAGGNIAWFYDETNNWPVLTIWDNGHYRFELNVSNVTSPDDWNEARLTSLIYALAGEPQLD